MLTIRAASQEDLLKCEKLGNIKEFKSPAGKYFVTDYLKHYLDKNFFLVAVDKEELVGLLIAEPVKAQGALVWYLTVKKDHRDQGIGDKLMQQFQKNCQKQHIEWIELYCPADNILSQKFYKTEGFNKGQLVYEFEQELI